MRILYVALTRASQKLILTGVMKSIDEIVDIQEKLLINEDPDIPHHKGNSILLYHRLRKTNNYLSWILATILRHQDIIEQCLSIDELKERALLLKEYHFEQRMTFDSTEHAMFSLFLTNDQDIQENIPSIEKQPLVIDGQLQENYRQFVYPYDIKKEKSLAVTTLQKIADDHYLSLSPQEEAPIMNATSKGTLVHLFMSYLTFQQDHVETLIQQLYDEKLCDENEKKLYMSTKTNFKSL